MANLLYVTPDVLTKLRTHRAYRFWNPLVQNQPVRQVPPEERVFRPRDIEVEEGYFYLTIDMKFVYCRNGQLSFLYEDQDLSFRLSCSKGILRTPDNKQFTAIIGRIAKAASSSDVELVDTDRVYHPFFDDLLGDGLPAAPPPPPTSAKRAQPAPPKPPPAKKAPAASNGKPKAPPKTAKADDPPEPKEDDGMVLGKYPKPLCDKIVNFRSSSKKSYAYLSDKFDMTAKTIKEICDYYRKKSKAAKTAKMKLPKAAEELDQEMIDRIIHAKRVSKKSYAQLSKRFELPEETIRAICAKALKRPPKK